MPSLTLPSIEAMKLASPYLQTSSDRSVQPDALPLERLTIPASKDGQQGTAPEIHADLRSSIDALEIVALDAPRSSSAPSSELFEIPFAPYNTPALTPSNSLSKLYGQRSQSPVTNTFDGDDSFLLGAPLIPSSSRFSAGLNRFNLSLCSRSSGSSDDLDVSTSSESDALLDLPLDSPPLPPVLRKRSDRAGLGITGMGGLQNASRSLALGGPGRNLLTSSASYYGPHYPRDDFELHSTCLDVDMPGAVLESDHSLVPGDSNNSLSEMLNEEMLRTFRKDSLHLQVMKTMPNCESWYELEGFDQSRDADSSFDRVFTSTPAPSSRDYSRRRLQSPHVEISQTAPKLRKHFSSATISSELKRVHSVPPGRRRFICTRPRSVSCPTACSIVQAPSIRRALSASDNGTKPAQRKGCF